MARRKQQGNFRVDVLFSLLFAVIGVLAIIIHFINDPGEEQKTNPETQGALSVELYWPDNMDCDIDLWVQSPADERAIGYSNKGGVVFNLLRDDLGLYPDLSNRNMEIAYSRGLPDGEYTINAHLFSVKNITCKLPIPISLVVGLTKNNLYSQLFRVNYEMKSPTEERTLANFVVYENQFVEKSFNQIQRKIRPAVFKEFP